MRQLALRCLSLFAVVVSVSMLTFSVVRSLPGDPVVSILGPDASIPERRAQVEQDLGLDRPVIAQYLRWVGGAIRGDFGHSYVDRQPVSTLVGERLPVTLELLVLTQILALAVAVPVATVCARRKDGLLDRVVTASSFAALSVPNFALAVVLVYVFAVKLQWVPASGFTPISEDPIGNLRSVVLPVIVLSVGITAVCIRLLRSEMITTLQEDFIAAAQAKGIPTRRILLRHALPLSSFSLFTVMAVNFGALIGGSVIVEYLFALPGIGSLLIQRIGQRDYIVVQGIVLLTTTAFVCANFAVDLLYGVLDPRIRER